MNKTEIITHRGLQPSKKDHPFESSLEAFQLHIRQGWGIEFDPNFSRDSGKGASIVAMHDATLKRITDGVDQRPVKQVSFAELIEKKLPGDWTIPTLDQVLSLIGSNPASTSAMHLKGIFQGDKTDIDLLLDHLKDHPAAVARMLIFDIKPDNARYMLSKIPDLVLAPSVAHRYDIERFNLGAMRGTLIPIDEALRLGPNGEQLYQWAWADEWDLLADKQGNKKQFYTTENFDLLHEAGYKIALVTPELHGTSPGLLGGEAHPDAKPFDRLITRIKSIIDAKPDAVCTDYPEEVEELIKNK